MSTFNLDAYLERIGHAGDLGATPEALASLHLAHATHVPFENADIQLGLPIRLDLASLQAKLVDGRRGGYCFEQNTLFAAALEHLGFAVTRLAARVRLNAAAVNPRTHMLLRVDVAGTSWLADVGFGGAGPLWPIPFVCERVVEQGAWRYRLVEEASSWLLQTWHAGAWRDLYVFTLEPQLPIDFEVANHYTATHPSSRFVQMLMAHALTPEARFILRNRELTTLRGEQVSTEALEESALLGVLAERFGLRFPAGTRFRCLAGPTEGP